MGRKKITNDIAVRFWEGNEKDERAAAIMERIPQGAKNDFIKSAICEIYKDTKKKETPITETQVREIVSEELDKALKNALSEQQQSLLVQISNMIGKLEGTMQVKTIAPIDNPQEETKETTKAIAKDDVDIPDFALDFINTLS